MVRKMIFGPGKRWATVLATAALAAAAACGPLAGSEGPRNIILLIGDGMGVAHLTMSQIEAGRLNAERMPVGGLIRTSPYGSLVTDSAASGTAIATGFRTGNGLISMSPGGDTLKTVLEFACERGMSTGLVATSSITHATPAAFCAHVMDRDEEAEIARQMAGSCVDVMIGGGWSYFVPRGEKGSGRDDDLDLARLLMLRMPVVRSPEELMRLDGASSVAALLAPGECPPAGERDYTLAELTSKAIDILCASSSGRGFFLMVEGSQIDWAAHDMDGEGLSAELLDFDGAVGAALDFAEADGSTLVIMTADHETGGLSLVESSLDGVAIVEPDFATDGHTIEMVPIFASGPGADIFGGLHDNTFIGTLLIKYVNR